MVKDSTSHNANKNTILKCNRCSRSFKAYGILEGSLCKVPVNAVNAVNAGGGAEGAEGAANLGTSSAAKCGGTYYAIDADTHDAHMRKKDGAA